MNLVINVAYGGENVAQDTLVPRVRIIRKEIKETFSSYIQDGLDTVKIYLFFNGDITSYYEKTGLYKPAYYPKKKEFVVTLCFDNSDWSANQSENLTLFDMQFRNYLIEIIRTLESKLKKHNIMLDTEIFISKIDKIISN